MCFQIDLRNKKFIEFRFFLKKIDNDKLFVEEILGSRDKLAIH